MTSFNELGLHAPLLQRLQELTYHTPTPIQAAAIPVVLAGKDVAGQAETGSGKTAAYGLPLLQQVTPQGQQVQVLVLVPTRELAVQVRQELKNFAQHLGELKISAFYGGHPFAREQASLAFPPQVLIGTPGRITDHLNRRTLRLNHVRHLVLDEADKLLEMDFEEELNQILDNLPRKRQSILFSATMPEKVQSLIRRSLKNPEFIQISPAIIPEQIAMRGIRVPETQKRETLLTVLRSFPQNGTVLFLNTRIAADELTDYLQSRKLAAKALHGGMEQIDRDKTMTLFRNGSVPILVATDLAARGLDIAALNTIIHLELPDNEAAFLHRSGRVGRAGRSGTVYVLTTPGEERKLREWKAVTIHDWVNGNTFQNTPPELITQTVPQLATLHIKAGRKDKLSPRDIVGALIAEAGIPADQIGKIEVQDQVSFVAVPAAQSQDIAQKLNNAKIKGRKFRVSVVK